MDNSRTVTHTGGGGQWVVLVEPPFARPSGSHIRAHSPGRDVGPTALKGSQWFAIPVAERDTLPKRVSVRRQTALRTMHILLYDGGFRTLDWKAPPLMLCQ